MPYTEYIFVLFYNKLNCIDSKFVVIIISQLHTEFSCNRHLSTWYTLTHIPSLC